MKSKKEMQNNYIRRVFSKLADYIVPSISSSIGLYFAMGKFPSPVYIPAFYLLFTLTVIIYSKGETFGNLLFNLRRTSGIKKTLIEEVIFASSLYIIYEDWFGFLLLVLYFMPLGRDDDNYINTPVDITFRRKILDLE